MNYIQNINDNLITQHFHSSRVLSKINEKISILKSELFQIEDEIKICIESKKDDYAIRSIVDKHKYLAGSLEDLGVDFKHLFKSNHIESVNSTKKIRQNICEWSSQILEKNNSKFDLKNSKICDIFLDYKLPDCWDWNNDILLIYLPENPKIIEIAINRGAKNIIVYCNNLNSFINSYDKNFPSFVSFYEKIEEFYKYIKSQNNHYKRIQIIDNKIKDNNDENLHLIYNLLKYNSTLNISNKITDILFNECSSQNFLINLKFLKKHKLIKQINCKNVKSAVVVGAGPSLDKNISTLSKFQDRVLIISCLHSLPALTKNNITPDIVLHAHLKNFNGFEKLTKPNKSNPIKNLILDTKVDSYLFNYPAENIFHYPFSNYSEFFTKDLGIDHKIYHGSNVSEFCIKILLHLGIKNIALIGNDLSYPEKKIYGKDLSFTEAINFENQRMNADKIIVNGYNGGTVESSKLFKLYINQLSQLAENSKIAKRNVKFFNATEGGALINNYKNIKLSTFLRNYGSSNEKKEIYFDKLSKNDCENIEKNISKFILNTKTGLLECLKVLKNLSKLSKRQTLNYNENSKFNDLIQNLIILSDVNWFIGLSGTHLTNEFNLLNKGKMKLIENRILFEKLYLNYQKLLNILEKNYKNL